MTKRKWTQREDKERLQDDKERIEEGILIAQKTADVPLRNIYGTRVVVEATRTPSGTRYVFEVGEVKPVLSQDVVALLDLRKVQGACCGQGQQPDRRYFQEV